MSYYYALRANTISQIWWLPLYLGARPLKRKRQKTMAEVRKERAHKKTDPGHPSEEISG